MQAASRDARLIMLGICITWTVADMMTHKWSNLPMDTIIVGVFIGMCWPIKIFASKEERL